MTTKLISREPTEEMLRAALDSDSGFKLSTPLEELYVNIFKAMYDAAPSINPWVSVKERLPENHGMYFCLRDTEDMVVTLWYVPIDSRCSPHFTQKNITHWWDESIMPIPRPEE